MSARRTKTLEINSTVRVTVSDKLARALENGTYEGSWFFRYINTIDAYQRFFQSNCFRNNGYSVTEFSSKQVPQEDE